MAGDLPAGFSEMQSLEAFHLRDGLYLVAAKGSLPASNSPQLDSIEKEVIRRLSSIQFDKRIPSEMAKIFGKEEGRALDGLVKKGMVQLFFGSKYSKEGVYKISDFAFQQSREPYPPAPRQHPLPQTPSKPQPSSSQPSKASNQNAAFQPSAASPPPISSPEHLEKFGYMVLDTEGEARNFASAHPDRIKSGEVKGVRAFDKKFYFVRNSFLSLYEKKIPSSLGKGEKTAEEVSDELGLSVEGGRALLLHLCESGELLEKHRGKFARA